MVNYNWEIEGMDVYSSVSGLDSVVYKIHWRLIATSEHHSADVFGEAILSAPDPEDFTPYGELTKEDVVSWVGGYLDSQEGEEAVSVSLYKQYLANILAAKESSLLAPAPLPWQ